MTTRNWLAGGILAVIAVSGTAWAAKAPPKKALNPLKVPAIADPVAPDTHGLFAALEEADALARAQALAAAKDSKDSKRKPASQSKIVGSEDLMSKAHKEFRDRLVAVKDPRAFAALLKEHDSKYASLPNDLKFVVARMSPFLAFRGFFWRMAPLAHRSVMTQQMLLGMVRYWAEQIMILEPDTQWQAYLGFLAIPEADMLQPQPPRDDKVNRPDQAFYVENDFVRFLGTEVYNALWTATDRLAKLKTTRTEENGREVPLVIDNKIRFGKDAFNDNYDAMDRFAIVGEAERHIAMGRFHRRMGLIAQLAAYDWNGSVMLRKEIGRRYGVDSKMAAWTGEDALGLDGVPRMERVSIARKPEYANLYRLRDFKWMHTAYRHFRRFAVEMNEGWAAMRDTRENYDSLLDPDLFMGRKDQIDKAMATLLSLFPPVVPNPAPVTIVGAIGGEELQVNAQRFFYDPPKDLKDLMPVEFRRHEDIKRTERNGGLEGFYGEARWIMKEGDSTVEMLVAGKKTQWRNYLYGRAVGWKLDEFKKLYPGLKTGTDVALAQRVVFETRGARPLFNGFVNFIK